MTVDLHLLWQYAWPLWILWIAGLCTLVTAVAAPSRRLGVTAATSVLGFAASAYGFFDLLAAPVFAHVGFLRIAPFHSFLCLVIALGGLWVALTSYRYWRAQSELLPEFFSLLLWSASGMMLMLTATHWISLVLGLEVMSLSLYVMAGLRRHDPPSSEAAFKYFLLGSVATAFLLLGISCVYGATGSLSLHAPWVYEPDMVWLCRLGSALILAGFAFKVAAAPFHFWAPDVYSGAPVPVTAWMSTGVKVAAFGTLLSVQTGWSNDPNLAVSMRYAITLLALATMIVGNLGALRQSSLKRIMAYSSVAHAGYLLLGVSQTGLGHDLRSALGFYLVAYSVLSLGVFGILTFLSSLGAENDRLSQLDGLAERQPVVAAALAVFLISLAGLPPTAGFFAKYLLLSQTIQHGLYIPAVVGVLSSAVSLYYYLGPVIRMYFHRSHEASAVTPPAGWSFRIVLLLMIAAVFYLGLFPDQVIGRFRF